MNDVIDHQGVGYWSASRAVIVRGATGPTWWIPWPVELPASPVGQRLLADPEADWRMNEREHIAVFGETAPAALQSGRGEAIVSRVEAKEIDLCGSGSAAT
jgi:hypothetical protein